MNNVHKFFSITYLLVIIFFGILFIYFYNLRGPGIIDSENILLGSAIALFLAFLSYSHYRIFKYPKSLTREKFFGILSTVNLLTFLIAITFALTCKDSECMILLPFTVVLPVLITLSVLIAIAILINVSKRVITWLVIVFLALLAGLYVLSFSRNLNNQYSPDYYTSQIR